MKQKSTRSKASEKKSVQAPEEKYFWNPDKVLDALLNNSQRVEEKWPETGLPKLVDNIMIDHS